MKILRFRRLLGVTESNHKSAKMFHHMDFERVVLTFKSTYAVRLKGIIVCYWQAQKLPSYLIFPYLVCIVWRYMTVIYSRNEYEKEKKKKIATIFFRKNFTLAREMFMLYAWKWITCMEVCRSTVKCTWKFMWAKKKWIAPNVEIDFVRLYTI